MGKKKIFKNHFFKLKWFERTFQTIFFSNTNHTQSSKRKKVTTHLLNICFIHFCSEYLFFKTLFPKVVQTAMCLIFCFKILPFVSSLASVMDYGIGSFLRIETAKLKRFSFAHNFSTLISGKKECSEEQESYFGVDSNVFFFLNFY